MQGELGERDVRQIHAKFSKIKGFLSPCLRVLTLCLGIKNLESFNHKGTK